MKFSTRGEYGLRAAVSLAKSYPAKKTIKEISAEERISVKYLERITGDLRRGGIVTSSKGKNGGYVLADNPKKIKVGQVIECTEGPILIKCYGTKCKMMHKCPSSLVWIKLGEQIRKTLYGIKLSDLMK
ncbi:MAG: Rrf2 family transcriptional regulator, iron-sulfur cluster assembly transcription factor [Patescibacteria group bacterium]|nr:Rrf2 family transcriptional regulator, iron-sulfur cluster assembly transcription factor [Patescibacteria group bacterium]